MVLLGQHDLPPSRDAYDSLPADDSRNPKYQYCTSLIQFNEAVNAPTARSLLNAAASSLSACIQVHGTALMNITGVTCYCVSPKTVREVQSIYPRTEYRSNGIEYFGR